MLPKHQRIHRAREFGEVVKSRGIRCGCMVVYVDPGSGSGPARVGLIVGRQVGNSVARHTVSRRLRHAVAPLMSVLPAGTRVVLRALPSSSEASSSDMSADLRRCFGDLVPGGAA